MRGPASTAHTARPKITPCRCRTPRRRRGSATVASTASDSLAAVVYCCGGGADVSVCQSPNSLPCGSLQAENQPMPGTGIGSPASPPSSLTRAARPSGSRAPLFAAAPAGSPGDHGRGQDDQRGQPQHHRGVVPHRAERAVVDLTQGQRPQRHDARFVGRRPVGHLPVRARGRGRGRRRRRSVLAVPGHVSPARGRGDGRRRLRRRRGDVVGLLRRAHALPEGLCDRSGHDSAPGLVTGSHVHRFSLAD